MLVLLILRLIERCSRWESHLRSVWDEWLLGSVPVDSVDHGVGESVNFGIDVLLGDISNVSLVERWREGNLRSVWDEWLLRSVPVDSVNHGVGETVNFGINVLFRNILSVSIFLVKSWSSSSWESDFRSVWNESILTSWPWESINVFVSEVLNILVNSFLADISVVSLIKLIILSIVLSLGIKLNECRVDSIVWVCKFRSRIVRMSSFRISKLPYVIVHFVLTDILLSILDEMEFVALHGDVLTKVLVSVHTGGEALVD